MAKDKGGKKAAPSTGDKNNHTQLIFGVVILIYFFYMYASSMESKLYAILSYYTVDNNLATIMSSLKGVLPSTDTKLGLYCFTLTAKMFYIFTHYISWFLLLAVITTAESNLRLSKVDYSDFSSVFNPRVYHSYYRMRYIPMALFLFYLGYMNPVRPEYEFMLILGIIAIRSFIRYQIVIHCPPIN